MTDTKPDQTYTPVAAHEHLGGCPVKHVTLRSGGEREPLAGYEQFDAWRAEAPMHWVEEGVGYHVFTRQEDVLAAAQNPKLFSNRREAELRGEPFFPLKPQTLDAPEHPKWRRVLGPSFAPGVLAGWDDRIRERAVELIDGFYESGECDFVRDFALRFPTSIFLSLMGLPQSDLDKFLVWETAILHPGADGTFGGLTMLQAQEAVTKYFRELLVERRANPLEESADDLVSQALTWEIDGEPIADEDLLSFYLLMFMAGLDTVTAELAYGMYHLATHPADRDRIVADPSVVPTAVEELLRVYPIVNISRVVMEDTTINGCPVKKGESVTLSLPSVGRDESVYENATKVDFDREQIPHLTFGAGPHRCLGSHLARHELAIAYEEWHKRIPTYEVAAEVPFTESVSGLFALNNLPLRWDVER